MNSKGLVRFFATAAPKPKPTSREVTSKKIWLHLKQAIPPVPKKIYSAYNLFMNENPQTPFKDAAPAWKKLPEKEKAVSIHVR